MCEYFTPMHAHTATAPWINCTERKSRTNVTSWLWRPCPERGERNLHTFGVLCHRRCWSCGNDIPQAAGWQVVREEEQQLQSDCWLAKVPPFILASPSKPVVPQRTEAAESLGQAGASTAWSCHGRGARVISPEKKTYTPAYTKYDHKSFGCSLFLLCEFIIHVQSSVLVFSLHVALHVSGTVFSS